jgi:hypothetical protein
LKKRSATVAKNANEAAKNTKSDAAAVTKIVHDADKNLRGKLKAAISSGHPSRKGTGRIAK